MGEQVIDGMFITPLSEIETAGGKVYHAMKAGDAGYSGFGEAYFSTIDPQAVKPWRRHLRMTLNLIVPIGRIRFVLFDERPDARSYGKYVDVTLGLPERYGRLTVPPCVWMAFQGLADGTSWLLNVADLEHDAAEVERRELHQIPYEWSELK
jgi:dTDP-4-dehydrorhamnose 3,5-epimerase